MIVKIRYEKGQNVGECVFLAELEPRLSNSGMVRFAEFECKCGNKFIATIKDVKKLHTRSCGCLHTAGLVSRNSTHGMRYFSEYNIWLHIKRRCYNKKSKNYIHWGGRGIGMCDEWRNSFEAFYLDMGARPSKKHSIDREDNNKGYYKGNCRWVLPIVQLRNTTRNFMIEYNGQTKALSEWSEMFGFPYRRAYSQMRRKGVSLKEIIESNAK